MKAQCYDYSISAIGDNIGSEAIVKAIEAAGLAEIQVEKLLNFDVFVGHLPDRALDGFTENKIVYKKTENPSVPEHSLTIEAPNGIKQLKVETTSFQFADVPSFDLCNLTDAARTRLQQLDFPMQEVKDKQELTFVLTDFAKALELSSETQTTLHTFSFYVLDNLNQETTVVFTYEVRPNVAAYVEKPYCWTTFALLKGYCIGVP